MVWCMGVYGNFDDEYVIGVYDMCGGLMVVGIGNVLYYFMNYYYQWGSQSMIGMLVFFLLVLYDRVFVIDYVFDVSRV